MKNLFSSRGLFVMGFVVIIAVNVIVLSGVASNRSGKPDALIKLSERELQLPYRVNKENSGLYLRLSWRVVNNLGNSLYTPSFWLDEKKLSALGFDTDGLLKTNNSKKFNLLGITKEVFVVLENNGEHYQQVLEETEKSLLREKSLTDADSKDKKMLAKRIEAAQKRLRYEQVSASRLFIIDAGLNPDLLRKNYADRSQYIITRGIISPYINEDKNGRELTGIIRLSGAEKIHVPLKHRRILDMILAQKKSVIPGQNTPPRYEVEIAYGHRLEPWIVSVNSLEDNGK